VTGTRVPYKDGNLPLEGYLSAPSTKRQRPGVLVVPTWLNVDESICVRADRLAAAGYTVLVADLFGADVRPAPPQQPMSVVAPFLSDRLLFRRRMRAALHTLQRRTECDASRIGAVGYCLGGCGVLELARSGASLQGVVSLHGILTAPIPAAAGAVTAKVLVLQGDADPLAPFDQLGAFRDEMLRARANWEINIYGDARHSFTGEGTLNRETPEAGLHEQSERRSWLSTLEFLREVLA
jgi:dienelactone hydrolase